MFRAIYYANKTFNEAQDNYSTTEKEMLAIVFACEKFRSYILGSHIIIHTNHATIKYLWAIKKLNFNFKAAKEERLLQLNELEELRNEAYDSVIIDSCHSRLS